MKTIFDVKDIQVFADSDSAWVEIPIPGKKKDRVVRILSLSEAEDLRQALSDWLDEVD